MEILKVKIPKEKFRTIPEDEQVFFIQAGRIMNDINILHKLITFSNNEGRRVTKNENMTKAQNSQSFFYYCFYLLS